MTALVGGRVLPSPQAAVIPDGVVLIEDATITAVGARGAVRVPPGASLIDCSGGTVTAGFWNSHVHFTGAAFSAADTAPAESVAVALRAMLTSYGVVHVVDTGQFASEDLGNRVHRGRTSPVQIFAVAERVHPSANALIRDRP